MATGHGSQWAAVTRGEVRILDLTTGRLVTTIPPPADMQESIQGLDTSTGAWAPDGSLYVGSSGTHLRQFDPVEFEPIRDITVPKIAMGGTLQFSEDGAFVVGRGTNPGVDGRPRRSPASTWTDGHVAWTIDADEFDRIPPASRSPSRVPDDRLWCADYTGVIRGRSLSTGELDGTTVEHQRSGLSSIAVRPTAVTATSSPSVSNRRSSAAGRSTVPDRSPATSPLGTTAPSTAPTVAALVVAAAIGRMAWVHRGRVGRSRRPRRPHPTGGPGLRRLAGRRPGRRRHRGRARAHRRRPHGWTREVPIVVEPGWVQTIRVADGRIAFAYPDRHIDVFDFDKGRQVTTLRRSDEASDAGANVAVGMMAPSADGSRLYVLYMPGRGVYEFDASDGQQLQWYPDTGSNSVAVGRDGPVAIGHTDGTVTLHDPDDLSVVGTLPGARSYAVVTYDHDGRFLVVTGATGRWRCTTSPGDSGWATRSMSATRESISGPTAPRSPSPHCGRPGITLWSLDPAR